MLLSLLRRHLPRSLLAGGLLLAFAALPAACAPPLSDPLPTAVPPTATSRVAFPTLVPTVTNTPRPTQAPAINPDFTAGELIYEDQFTSNLGWDVGEFENSGATIMGGRLVIAVRQPNELHLAPSPAGALDDYYMEVSSFANACNEGDQLGIVFRLQPGGQYYRFTISCEGRAAVAYQHGKTSTSIIPRTRSAEIIRGVDALNRLSVLARGGQYRLFVNGVELFVFQDARLSAGGVGLFVQSGRTGQTTISFRSLRIYAVHQP